MFVKSYAKINLSLQNLGVREDGYHELDMVNLPLELHDVLEIDYNPLYKETYIVCDDVRLMGLRSNICKKMVDLLREKYHFKQHFLIHIHKEIPFAAGLGGGSSNAAALMLALDKYLKLNMSEEDKREIALKVGSDVPFFIFNKPARVKGIGEKLEFISVPVAYHCLLIKPEQGLSTKDVYNICDKFPKREINNDKVQLGLKNDDEEMVAKNRGNDLYFAANSLCSEVGDILAELNKDGFTIFGMSGSGSTVFALSKDGKKIKTAANKYEKRNYKVIQTRIIPSSK